ncbi:MAG TPA: branched-chain amino acid ABC transporter permease [Thermodesulfobacteriota bacterium]|nr:branched-chain amino acid ABC transporter permease [Thermodesulfobacteriota bacterium]
MTFQLFLQQLINAVSLGSLYGLVAIGYTMVYGILRLINFAHGDVLMVGCYFAFYATLIFSLPWYLSFFIAVFLTAVLGIAIDRGAYLPVRKAPRISALITAIGVSFLLENLALVIFGGRPKAFYRPPLFSRVVAWGDLHFLTLSLWIPFITLVLILLLLLIIYRTRAGMAMRAISRDMETVRLMGADVNRIISMTFALGSALAAAGGILWALKFPQIDPYMGIIPGLKAFVAAVLGGIGNVIGAALGGFLLGLLEIMLVAFMPSLGGYKDAFAFLILIGILLFRPAGMMGEKLPD